MRVLRVVLAVLLVMVVSFLSLAGSFGTARGLDAIRQIRRMGMLESPAMDLRVALPDSTLPGDTPLDRVQVIATHNSYHIQAGPLQYFLVGLFQPGEPAKLRYTHVALYDQLDLGVRSFELDIRNRVRRIVVSHVPMVDNRATTPDLRRALEEIRLWSERNPAHVPISVLLELKEDWGFLDPRLAPWDTAALARLDTPIRSVFPTGTLLTPDSVPEDGGWPALDQVRGRVLFILHYDPRITPLYTGSTMWISAAGEGIVGSRRARIQILNDPVGDAALIAASLARGDLVRTRADADLVADPARVAAALASGAQIISTDHPGSGGVVLPGGSLTRVLE